MGDVLSRRNHELSILNTIAQSLNREVDLMQVMKTVLHHVAELLDLQTAWIFLLDEEQGRTYLAASQDLPSGLANDPARMQGDCSCLEMYLEGEMGGGANIGIIGCTRLRGLVNDGLDDGTAGLRYHASIPLYVREKKLGVLNVASKNWQELSPDDLRLLYTVGDVLSMAIERSRLFAKSVELGAVEERNRLAREIHDTVAQGLAALALRLETADALFEAGADLYRVKQTIKQALELTRANLTEVRRSVLDLRAAPLEGRTLIEALQQLAESYIHEWDLKIDFNTNNANHPLSSRIEIGLYRIVQEAFTNIRRHAHAHHVTARLVTTPDCVQLFIEDDGQGFDVDQFFTDGHYGVIGMNERVKLLGGYMELHSSPGEGTSLEVYVPLETTS